MMTQMTPPPVAATLPMSVQLEAQQWNQVIATLGDAPYRIAAPLIQSITEQLQTQAQAQHQPAKPNGAGLDIHEPVSGEDAAA